MDFDTTSAPNTQSLPAVTVDRPAIYRTAAEVKPLVARDGRGRVIRPAAEPAHSLYITPQTRGKLGALAEDLPRLAGMSVFVLDDDDIGGYLERNCRQFSGGECEYTSAASFNENARHNRQELLRMLGQFPGFPREGLEAWARTTSDTNAMDSLAGYADMSQIMALPFPSSPGGAVNDTCVLIVPPMDKDALKDPRGMMTLRTFMPVWSWDWDQKRLPGTGKEWAALMIARLAASCDPDPETSRRKLNGYWWPKEGRKAQLDFINRAIDAEFKALTYYLEKGHNPRVAQTYLAMRRIGVFERGANIEHLAGAFVDIENGRAVDLRTRGLRPETLLSAGFDPAEEIKEVVKALEANIDRKADQQDRQLNGYASGNPAFFLNISQRALDQGLLAPYGLAQRAVQAYIGAAAFFPKRFETKCNLSADRYVCPKRY